MKYFLRFNAVGILGVGVQLAALALFRSGLNFDYLTATALAVEIAVLHNFAWHERWTWQDRDVAAHSRAGRLLRFHFTVGLVSMFGNLIVMRLLAGRLHFPYLVANLFAIGACALVNFLASDRFVFRAAPCASRPTVLPPA